MGHAVAVRTDYTADEVRRLAKRVKDAAQARRLLAIAAVLDGASRTAAARIGGMDRQTLRDWVIRFNDQGPDGLINIPSPGLPPSSTQCTGRFSPALWRKAAGGSAEPIATDATVEQDVVRLFDRAMAPGDGFEPADQQSAHRFPRGDRAAVRGFLARRLLQRLHGRARGSAPSGAARAAPSSSLALRPASAASRGSRISPPPRPAFA
jgi:hypothetical protein